MVTGLQLLWVGLSLLSINIFTADKASENDYSGRRTKTQITTSDSLVYYCQQFNKLNSQIRDAALPQATAVVKVSYLLNQIKRHSGPYFSSQKVKSGARVFPLQGYNYTAIGGTNGSGYLPKGYTYYAGNKHTGHPAHDIFIRDTNQDLTDDRTKKPVNVLSVNDGVVVAYEPKWEPASSLRGGIYVWVYNPQEQRLYYYAHNRQLLVKPGDVVKVGQALGTVGRSGLNAYKKRSPTHLHFMVLQVKPKGVLEPINLYPVLKKIK